MRYFIFFFALISSNLLFSQQNFNSTFQEAEIFVNSFFEKSNLLETDYTPKYYRLEMNIDPHQSGFSGKTTVYFEPEEAMIEFKINANSNLDIGSIQYHESTITDFVRNDNVLSFMLPDEIPAGQLDSLSVQFSGFAESASGVRLASHNGVPVFATLSEPWHASSWWVCKDDLLEKVESMDVFITHPSEFKAGSNGKLISITDAGNGNSITHWQHLYPIPAYLVGVAVTNYVEYNNFATINGTEVPIINYLYPESLSQWQTALDQVPSFVEYFSEIYGEYPYINEKYGHAQWNLGGGMEHSTMSFMGGFDFGLVAHELAHQWFGNKITCASWADIWLNEGFAEYGAGLLRQHFISENNFLNWKENGIDWAISSNGGSVYVNEPNNENRIFDYRLTYKKASMVVHLIRYILNDDELFYQVLQNYLDDPAHAYGYADTEQFKSSIEASTGMDWSHYFDEWIYGQGYPNLNIVVSKSSDSNDLTVSVSQSGSHTSVPYFHFPFEIEFQGAGGQSTIRRFEITGPNQSFTVNDLTFATIDYLPNPNYDIICSVNSATLNNVEIQDNQVQLAIFPNPAKSDFTVKADENIEELRVFDVLGKIVFRQTGIHQNHLKVDSKSWVKGVYMVQVFLKDKVKLEKVLLE